MHVSVSRDMIINGAIVNCENVAFFKHYTIQHCAKVFAPITSPLLSSRRQAAAIGVICRLFDGEGCGNMQTFYPQFVTYNTRSSCLFIFDDPAKDYRLVIPDHWTDFYVAGLCLLKHLKHFTADWCHM